MSVAHNVSEIFTIKYWRDLEIWVRGHWHSRCLAWDRDIMRIWGCASRAINGVPTPTLTLQLSQWVQVKSSQVAFNEPMSIEQVLQKNIYSIWSWITSSSRMANGEDDVLSRDVPTCKMQKKTKIWKKALTRTPNPRLFLTSTILIRILHSNTRSSAPHFTIGPYILARTDRWT